MNRHSWHSWPGYGGCKGLEAGIGVLRDVVASGCKTLGGLAWAGGVGLVLEGLVRFCSPHPPALQQASAPLRHWSMEAVAGELAERCLLPMEATAEEGRDCSNQLNPLNEQLIGGCLDRKLEEARRRRKRRRWCKKGRRGRGRRRGEEKTESISPTGCEHQESRDRHTLEVCVFVFVCDAH